MATTQRIHLMQTLAEVGALCPEMRMGQLMANLAMLARGPHKESIWDVEDDELLEAAKTQRDTLAKRRP